MHNFRWFRRSAALWVCLAVIACGEETNNKDVTDSAPAADLGTQAEVGPGADAASPGKDAASPGKDAASPGKDSALAKDSAAPKPCDKSYEGPYTSSAFSLTATEKLGSTIINKMVCKGSLSVVVKCSGQPVVQGSYTCTRSGGLSLFDKTQTGTLKGDLGAGGAFWGKITHAFGSSLKKTYSYSAAIKTGKISGSGSGSLLPNPKSVQPWEVKIVF